MFDDDVTCCDNYGRDEHGPCCQSVVTEGYDNQCCALIKDAYCYWTERQEEFLRETACQLTRYVNECKIPQHEFQIRHSLFQIGVQRLNRLLMFALRVILKRDQKKPCGGRGEFEGCFGNDYCVKATNLAIGASIMHLKGLSYMAVNLALNRSSHECEIRLTLQRAKDAFCVATADEGCRDNGNFLPDVDTKCGQW